MNKGSKTEIERVIEYVKKNPVQSITEISKHTNLNRMTVSKYLFALEMFGKVKFEQKGMNKLWSVKK